MTKTEEISLGTGQDATIVLVPTAGSTSKKNLALVHLQSHVLSKHSKYFNTCLSTRWKKQASSCAPIECVLEVQADVQYYFECFSNMYSPSTKTFEGVAHAVELLKVASQIDFQELMERISRYLACAFWSKQDQLVVREYAASPDFPREHLKDLVSRLGMDESEMNRHQRLCDFIRQCSRTALKASVDNGAEFPSLLRGIGTSPPSEFSRKVVTIFSHEAKEIFAEIDKNWTGKRPMWHDHDSIEKCTKTIIWVLKALLDEQAAEELVESIAHLKTIPEWIGNLLGGPPQNVILKRTELARLVLVMYEVAAAGRLLVRPPARVALLANWHAMFKHSLVAGSYEQATANLFWSLPVKQQVELLKVRPDKVLDYIGTTSLVSLQS